MWCVSGNTFVLPCRWPEGLFKSKKPWMQWTLGAIGKKRRIVEDVCDRIREPRSLWTSLTTTHSWHPLLRTATVLENLFEDFCVLGSVSTGHGSVVLRLSQDSVAVERQEGFLCVFRVVAYFSRFGRYHRLRLTAATRAGARLMHPGGCSGPRFGARAN